MNQDECSSVQMAQKLQHLSALIHMVKRTLDSSESSIYLREAVELMSAAGIMVGDCELLRQNMDADLYKSSRKQHDVESSRP